MLTYKLNNIVTYYAAAIILIAFASLNCIYSFSTTVYIENITRSLSRSLKAVTPGLDPPMAIYLIEFGQKKLSSRKRKKRKDLERIRTFKIPCAVSRSSRKTSGGIVLILSCGFLSRLTHVSS